MGYTDAIDVVDLVDQKEKLYSPSLEPQPPNPKA